MYSFTRSYGSQSASSDASSHRAEFLSNGTKEEGPRDIREYETIDHKILKQWEQNKAHLDQHQLGVCAIKDLV